MPTNAFGFIYPDEGDQVDVPVDILALANSVGPFSNMRFTNATARDALLTAPVEGMVCWLQDLNLWTYYNGTIWLPLGGDTQTYSPSWTASTTNPSIGNGSITGRYLQVGKWVFVSIEVVAGSTTTFGSGTYSLSLPVATRNTSRIGLPGIATDSSAAVRYPMWAFWVGGATSAVLVTQVVSGSDIIQGSLTHNGPVVWANGDTFMLQGIYEAA